MQCLSTIRALLAIRGLGFGVSEGPPAYTQMTTVRPCNSIIAKSKRYVTVNRSIGSGKPPAATDLEPSSVRLGEGSVASAN